jgi:carbonic anhydrase/SulP family sulfate permease
VTVAAIVLTDLLVGVLIGLAVSASFILWSNVRRPIRRIEEKHLGGDVVHVELPNQVSFLNRAALARGPTLCPGAATSCWTPGGPTTLIRTSWT